MLPLETVSGKLKKYMEGRVKEEAKGYALGAIARVEHTANARHTNATGYTELEVRANSDPASDARAASKDGVVAAGCLTARLRAGGRAVVGARAASGCQRHAVGLIEAGLVDAVARRRAVYGVRKGVRILTR